MVATLFNQSSALASGVSCANVNGSSLNPHFGHAPLLLPLSVSWQLPSLDFWLFPLLRPVLHRAVRLRHHSPPLQACRAVRSGAPTCRSRHAPGSKWKATALLIIEKVGLWSIFSRPKNGSTSLQNSLFEHCSKSRSASKRRKTAQLRSKTASSTQHNSVLVVTSRSLRGYFAVTSRLQRGHYAVTTVTTRSLRGHYGHYAVTTVTTRSEFETEKTLSFAPKRTI